MGEIMMIIILKGFVWGGRGGGKEERGFGYCKYMYV